LLADLCAPTWELVGSTIKVASRDEIIDKIGRSPDKASAYCLALIDTPKRKTIRAILGAKSGSDYDPMGIFNK